jgi:hypothetical protein
MILNLAEGSGLGSLAMDRRVRRHGTGRGPAGHRTLRLFIEQHGESRFEALDDPDARPVNNRAGWRKGSGPDREWMIPPEVWKSEICNGLDSTMVARWTDGSDRETPAP